jgi:hypothetical protein
LAITNQQKRTLRAFSRLCKNVFPFLWEKEDFLSLEPCKNIVEFIGIKKKKERRINIILRTMSTNFSKKP